MTERSDTGPQPRKWTRRSDARPQELIDAALRSFAERGFAGTRLDDVAAAAGVSKGTVYLYFEGKESLFEAVIRQSITPRIDQAEAMIDAFDGSTPNLIRTLFAFLEAQLDGPFPAVIKLIISECNNFPALARMWGDLAARRIFGLICRVVARGVERGEFRRVQPEELGPLLLAPVLFLGLWKQSLGQYVDIPLDPHKLLLSHVDLILRGLAPLAEGSGEGTR